MSGPHVKSTDWSLSRRALLRRLGVGAACVPLLQATRSYAADAKFPRRLVCVAQPQGYTMSAWLPAVGGLAEQTLPPAVRALEPHKNDLLFLPGMSNPKFRGCTACGRSAYGPLFSPFGARAEGAEFPEPSAATIDQHIATALARTTPPPGVLSLQVQSDNRPMLPAGARRCFWRGAGVPISPEASPYRAYEALFGGGKATDGAAERLLASKRSILDYVGGELRRYRERLGAEDRSSVEIHLQSIRELETRLSRPPVPGCEVSLGTPLDPMRGDSFAPMLDLQIKLITAALRCDAARIATLQIGDAQGNDVLFDFLPRVSRVSSGGRAARDWEDIARRPVDSDTKEDDKIKVDTWCMEKFASLIAALKAVGEGAGESLLDHSAILWATSMEDGITQHAQRVPWLIAGKCHGYFKTGQVAASAGKPLNGVLAHLCNALDVPTESFGDAAYGKPMDGLRP